MNQINVLKNVSACLLMTATCAELPAAPLTFATEQMYDVPGGTPYAILVVDTNSDNIPDVLTLGTNAYNEDFWGMGMISVLLGKGDGSLQYYSDNPTGPGAVAFAAGDLNADGKLDLVSAGVDNDSVSILLGRGDGAFIKTSVDYPVGQAGWPTGVAVGDTDNDGIPDIVVSNFDNTVSVLRGWGNGKFRKKRDYSVGNKPADVVLADINGDSRLDIMTPNTLDSSVSLLRGRGDGAFRVKIDRHASHAFNLAVADMNGDSFADLVTSGSVLLGNGKGGFRGPGDFLTPDHADRMAVGDLDRDGKPDLTFTVSNFANKGVSVLKGRGNGRFMSRQDFPLAFEFNSRPHAVAVADLNGDGKLDLVVGNDDTGLGQLSVLLNSSP